MKRWPSQNLDALTPSMRAIELRPGGSLRLCVVADTHSEPHPASLELIVREAPDAILHAGDIGALTVLEDLRSLSRLEVVRGNIDEANGELPDLICLDVTEGGVRALRIMIFHIAVAGPKLRVDARRLAEKLEANVVVCGHSHVPFIGRDRGFTVFNPGSIGPRRFQLPIVFGVIDIVEHRMTMKHIDCETGSVWLPQA